MDHFSLTKGRIYIPNRMLPLALAMRIKRLNTYLVLMHGDCMHGYILHTDGTYMDMKLCPPLVSYC